MLRSETTTQLIDIYQTSHLREMSASSILETYATDVRTRFKDVYAQGDMQPLFIPVRNEEEDIPATLLAIAQNNELMPVVIDNDSHDRTAKIARHMGAIVIDAPKGNKMAATKAGFEFAAEEQVRNLYFTDADTLVLPRWGQSMRQKLEQHDCGNGSAVFGNSILWHGESKTTDIILSMAKLGRAAMYKLVDGPVIARGHNYAVRLDANNQILRAAGLLDPAMFDGDDTAIRDMLLSAHAQVIGTSGLSTTVITRNDRVSSVRERLSRTYVQRRAHAYAREYNATNI